MPIPWIIASIFGGILVLKVLGRFDPPQSPLAAVRLRNDNRRDNFPIENSRRAIWLIIVGVIAFLALYSLIRFQ